MKVILLLALFFYSAFAFGNEDLQQKKLLVGHASDLDQQAADMESQYQADRSRLKSLGYKDLYRGNLISFVKYARSVPRFSKNKKGIAIHTIMISELFALNQLTEFGAIFVYSPAKYNRYDPYVYARVVSEPEYPMFAIPTSPGEQYKKGSRITDNYQADYYEFTGVVYVKDISGFDHTLIKLRPIIEAAQPK